MKIRTEFDVAIGHLERLATGGTHDPMPTRRLWNPETDRNASEVDAWWQNYFLSMRASMMDEASTALAAVRAMKEKCE